MIPHHHQLFNHCEVYLEQDWYYLASPPNGKKTALRRLPSDLTHGGTLTDPRGIWRMHLVQPRATSSSKKVDSAFEKKEKKLIEARIKLQSSKQMREGAKVYGKTLVGGEKFSSQIRKLTHEMDVRYEQEFLADEADTATMTLSKVRTPGLTPKFPQVKGAKRWNSFMKAHSKRRPSTSPAMFFRSTSLQGLSFLNRVKSNRVHIGQGQFTERKVEFGSALERHHFMLRQANRRVQQHLNEEIGQDQHISEFLANTVYEEINPDCTRVLEEQDEQIIHRVNREARLNDNDLVNTQIDAEIRAAAAAADIAAKAHKGTKMIATTFTAEEDVNVISSGL